MNGRDHSYENNAQTRMAIHWLHELIKILYPDPKPDVFTLDSFEFRYRLHGLNQTAIQKIEQSQRINRELRDYGQSGLNEFHIGLIYLYWGECHAAEKQFDLAWRQWSFVNEPGASSLAHLGQGFTQEFVHHDEAAMISYGKAWRDLRHMPVTAPNLFHFRERIEQCLEEAQETLREKMDSQPAAESPTGTAQADGDGTESEVETTTPESEVPPDSSEQQPEPAGEVAPPPPRSNLADDPMPIDGHEKVDGRYRWYLVEGRQADDLMPQIHPNDWLLVAMQPDQSDLSPTEEQPIVIVCQSESGGTIHLRPHPSEQTSHRHRIYLRELKEKTGQFVRNPETGKIFFPPTALSTGQGVVDLTEIIGIVVGLWRPTSQMVGKR